MTADQPLNENSTAQDLVGGGLSEDIQIHARKALTLILNSEGMLRCMDNFYFILIMFSFKL